MEKIYKVLQIKTLIRINKIQKHTRFFYFFVLFCLNLFLLLFFCAEVTNAATLYFFPSSGSYAVGDTFSLNINVSSEDQIINAASGVISFSQDKLEVVSILKNESIFSFWAQEPSFSNNIGTINFEGFMLNPGFTGTAGKIFNIKLKVKATGVAFFNFSYGLALANDGKGTNVLTNSKNASFNLNSATSATPKTETATPKTTPTSIGSSLLSAPQIFSSTHSDSTKWYAQKNGKFNWQVPSNVNSVKLLISQTLNINPVVAYTPPINEKKVFDLSDGIWYFYAQFGNFSGWGKVSQFRFQIDTQPPDSFVIKFIEGKETNNSQPVIAFDIIDSLSGVNYYKIKIDEKEIFTGAFGATKNNTYTLPLQTFGKHNILIQAFDKAGNSTVASDEFVIIQKEISEQTSTTTSYSEEVQKKESIIAQILTYSDIKIYLIIVFAVFLFFLTWYGWHKFLILRKQLQEKTCEVKSKTCEVKSDPLTLHKIFDLSKENIQEQVKILEEARAKRKLTEEEEKILNQFK
ncbi:MAG: cohesin domain-containing protein [Patescibacteria group bacterium]